MEECLNYCEECGCHCGCHPCKHTPDLVDFMIECGVPGYEAVKYNPTK